MSFLSTLRKDIYCDNDLEWNLQIIFLNKETHNTVEWKSSKTIYQNPQIPTDKTKITEKKSLTQSK